MFEAFAIFGAVLSMTGFLMLRSANRKHKQLINDLRVKLEELYEGKR